MTTITVGDNICFYYTDSGPPSEADYPTLFIIHGHTFHSGIFSRILSSAASQGLQILCVNRHEYPGSTPFTQEELKSIHEGSSAERSNFLLEQGILYCLLVDRLIETLSLPEEGGITISGWSMGNIFAIAMVTAINDLPEDTRQRLKVYVHKLLLWDPPTPAVGTPNPPGSYFPLLDYSLSPEVHGTTFGLWVSSYFDHGDLSSHDFNQYNQREPDPSRQATIHRMTSEEIAASTDFKPGPKCDTVLVSPLFSGVVFDQTNKALFDPACREQWGGLDVWHLYGDANIWIVLNTVWLLEKRMRGKEICFKEFKGANHFPMWDDPERTLFVLKECIEN